MLLYSASCTGLEPRKRVSVEPSIGLIEGRQAQLRDYLRALEAGNASLKLMPGGEGLLLEMESCSLLTRQGIAQQEVHLEKLAGKVFLCTKSISSQRNLSIIWAEPGRKPQYYYFQRPE